MATEAEWKEIERHNRANMLRLAKEAEAQGRSIAAFYSRKEQREFIAKHS